MTTINGVPRELLEFLCSNNNNALSRLPELRVLLAEQPQAGAGQDLFEWLVGLIDEECRYWHSAGDEARRSVCANLLASAKAAPQPPARHDQGDEVRRLREALSEAVAYLDSNRLNEIGSGSILHRQMQDALTQSPKGEEE